MPEYGWRTREVRERLLGQKPSKGWPRVDHVCHTARAPLWPRVAHAGHTWAGQIPTKNLDHFAPLSLYFKTLQFPPFSLKKKKCEIPSMIFSQFFSTSKHHNFLIRSRNWVIQVGDCSYSSPLPFPSGCAAVWSIFWQISSEKRTSSCNWGRVHNFVISSFLTSNLLGVSSSIYVCLFSECYRER